MEAGGADSDMGSAAAGLAAGPARGAPSRLSSMSRRQLLSSQLASACLSRPGRARGLPPDPGAGLPAGARLHAAKSRVTARSAFFPKERELRAGDRHAARRPHGCRPSLQKRVARKRRPGRAMAQETLGQSGDGLPQPVRVENQQHGSPSSAASWAVQPPPAPPPS